MELFYIIRLKTCFDYKNADWDAWSIKMEDNLSNADINALSTSDDIVNFIHEMVNCASSLTLDKKTITKYSKPYWNAELFTVWGPLQSVKKLLSDPIGDSEICLKKSF